jgi:hypothetical protein
MLTLILNAPQSPALWACLVYCVPSFDGKVLFFIPRVEPRLLFAVPCSALERFIISYVEKVSGGCTTNLVSLILDDRLLSAHALCCFSNHWRLAVVKPYSDDFKCAAARGCSYHPVARDRRAQQGA